MDVDDENVEEELIEDRGSRIEVKRFYCRRLLEEDSVG